MNFFLFNSCMHTPWPRVIIAIDPRLRVVHAQYSISLVWEREYTRTHNEWTRMHNYSLRKNKCTRTYKYTYAHIRMCIRFHWYAKEKTHAHAMNGDAWRTHININAHTRMCGIWLHWYEKENMHMHARTMNGHKYARTNTHTRAPAVFDFTGMRKWIRICMHNEWTRTVLTINAHRSDACSYDVLFLITHFMCILFLITHFMCILFLITHFMCILFWLRILCGAGQKNTKHLTINYERMSQTNTYSR